MQVNGLSKSGWEARKDVLKIVLLFSFVIFVILIFAASSTEEFADRTLPKKIVFVAMVVWMIIMFIISLITLIHATLGKRLYKQYAKDFIDYDDDAPIKRIEVSLESITLYFEEGRIIQRENLDYDDYEIIAKMNTNYTKPVFYVWGGCIKKVMLPYTEDPQAKWNTYNVRHMKKRR